MTVPRPVMTVVMLAAAVLGIIAGSRLFAVLAGG
jgi:hypothetical protein